MLQAVVGLTSLVPITAGIAGIVEGPAMLAGIDAGSPAAASIDLDSHYHYLSGLLLGIGLAFVTCAPDIERRTILFRVLGSIVVVGGGARLLSLLLNGAPTNAHLVALGLELGLVPLLLIWQARVARRLAVA
jgi:hypothetical protein